MSDDYFQLYDKDEINLIKSRWRLQSNSMYGQPLIKIDFEEQPRKVFQLPEVFMTSRQNQQKQSFREIPKKKLRKGTKISLNSLEVSPKIPQAIKKSEEKNQELKELHKSYYQYKKSFRRVKQSCHIIESHKEAQVQDANSSFYFNGVKMPYSLYMIGKTRQLALSNLMTNANPQVQEQAKQQMQLLDNQIKKVRNENQSKQKMKEYRSRSFLHNAYYSMLCVNSDSKKRLQKIFRGKFPQESRFQQL